jgi:hypothetical protein
VIRGKKEKEGPLITLITLIFGILTPNCSLLIAPFYFFPFTFYFFLLVGA